MTVARDVMTPDASEQVAAVTSYKSMAQPEPVRLAATSFNVIDGIVIDKRSKLPPAGPNAVILPTGNVATASK